MRRYVDLFVAVDKYEVPAERLVSLIREEEIDGVTIQQGYTVVSGMVNEDDVIRLTNK